MCSVLLMCGRRILTSVWLFSFFHIFVVVVVILTALLRLFSSKVLTGPKTL